MRITENMMAQAYLDGLNRNMEQIAEYQEQLSTNKRINRPSDDPVGVINSLTVRSNLSRLSQYSRNIDDASSWLTQSETALTDLNSSLVSVYELALQAGGGSMSKTDKLAIATEVKQIRDLHDRARQYPDRRQVCLRRIQHQNRPVHPGRRQRPLPGRRPLAGKPCPGRGLPEPGDSLRYRQGDPDQGQPDRRRPDRRRRRQFLQDHRRYDPGPGSRLDIG